MLIYFVSSICKEDGICFEYCKIRRHHTSLHGCSFVQYVVPLTRLSTLIVLDANRMASDLYI